MSENKEVGRLAADPLFLGLTRPAMMLGVTYNWFMVNGLIWVSFFIQTSDFGTLIPGSIFTHLIGYMICSKEPRFVELWIIRLQKCMKCKNAMFHGYTQSFDLY